MDVRYNVINWVHRSTRGWAYGSSITDPRTGEIIKGVVTLDSQRIRQDNLLGTGLVPVFGDGRRGAGCEFGAAAAADTEYLAQLDPAADPAQMSLARIRQLSAHEVGHTLGLAHNFAASTYGRASVMDYPAPLVEIKNGRLDLSNAYATGIGAYDKFAITYAYAQFPRGADEAAELEKMLEAGVKAGMLFISDDDARPAGAAHPLANLWDNGGDPVAIAAPRDGGAAHRARAVRAARTSPRGRRSRCSKRSSCRSTFIIATSFRRRSSRSAASTTPTR